MSKNTCYRCSRTSKMGNSRSHSNIKTKRKFKANLQTRTIDGKKVRVCTRCLKAESKVSKK